MRLGRKTRLVEAGDPIRHSPQYEVLPQAEKSPVPSRTITPLNPGEGRVATTQPRLCILYLEYTYSNMTTESKNILIFGGTGVIGKFLTQALLDAKQSFGHIALFTSPSTVQDKAAQLEKWKSQGLEIITGDITKDKQVSEVYQSLCSHQRPYCPMSLR